LIKLLLGQLPVSRFAHLFAVIIVVGRHFGSFLAAASNQNILAGSPIA
jgi:hypothetical protein